MTPTLLAPMEQAFRHVATQCEAFQSELSAKEPRGLHRLAYAFAEVGKEQDAQLQQASEKGLKQIAKVLRAAACSERP